MKYNAVSSEVGRTVGEVTGKRRRPVHRHVGLQTVTCLEVRTQGLRHMGRSHKASRGTDRKRYRHPTSKVRGYVAVGRTRQDVHYAEKAEFSVRTWRGSHWLLVQGVYPGEVFFK